VLAGPAVTASVGDVGRRSRVVSARDIELFTEITGDRNPLHYDADAAARSRFGGLIVQGGVTSGLLNAVVADDVPGPGSVFLHVDSSFRAPVRPGDEITAEVEVLQAREDKPLTKSRTTIVNQDGASYSTARRSSGRSRCETARPRGLSQRSRVTAVRGREQQSSTWPGAGSSSGSGS
jgi:acyl dehydratase